MFKSHERFHSANGKRLVLIVDDEFVNRELLRGALQADYELLFAENGQQALDLMREHADALSLVLLDLLMPVMNGFDVLKQAKLDPAISHVPIIVITSDQDAEIESLTLGASDFIPKPYPQPGVMQARVLKTIELTEDRQIISSTERDALTGLYNREYFYRYAEQYDLHHKGSNMDAIVVDINHFHMINERFGTARGDEVLRRIGTALREEVADVEGMVCRREADIFLVYCLHGLDYGKFLKNTTAKVSGGGAGETHVWLRMGVYENVDKELDVVRRFDRAKIAADTVQGSFTTQIGMYDDALHKQELFQEQLIEDFDAAIREHQFQVYYQPKFDIIPDIPVLASAEALVRWNHPTLGMVSPGVFIPLFEKNGLIQGLDTYVWRETASRIRNWLDRFGFAVPVSVNVSRIDMYDPHLVETLLEILAENDLSPHDMNLEVTESAYTQDSEQIITTVNRLRRLGFRIEMDDFGTGYSSLNMISTLPIDALKMDMQFIRTAFNDGGDTKMLEVIIDIAEHLSIPVIAEGVETHEQMLALRDMGCDYVQGYYFSRPVPADEYEKFVIERKEAGTPDLGNVAHPSDFEKHPFGDITSALSSGFESIFYVDTDSDHYVEFSSQGSRDDLQIETSGTNFFGDALRRALGPVYEEDRSRIELSLNKSTLMAQVKGSSPFSMTYRILEAGVLVFYSIEVARARTHDDHHIIVGISNVDAQVAEAEALKRRQERSITYARIAQALAADYLNIYCINAENDHFVEFSPHGSHEGLGVERRGSDFFGFVRESASATAHPDDLAMLLEELTKENVLAKLSREATFNLSYRRMRQGGPTDVRLKATLLEGESGGFIVIGVSEAEGAST